MEEEKKLVQFSMYAYPEDYKKAKRYLAYQGVTPSEWFRKHLARLARLFDFMEKRKNGKSRKEKEEE